MRIYAVADIHGHNDRFSVIQENISIHTPDVLIVAGDITNYLRPQPVIKKLNSMPVPVMAVRGNSDRPRVETLLDKSPNITSLDLKKTTLNGIHFTGISGTVPVPFRSRLRLREKPVQEKITQLLDPLSVLVAHPPPWGVLDRVLKKLHAGCRSLKEIILKAQPQLVICGHIHEDSGKDHINRTVVVNCSMGHRGAGALIDLNSDDALDVVFL